MSWTRSVAVGASAAICALAIGVSVSGQSPGSPEGLVIGRAQHSATLLSDGRVLVAGGFDDQGEFEASAELFDPGTDTSSLTGSMSVARRLQQAIPLPDGRVLIIGGATGDSEVVAPEVYDPATGSFDPVVGLPTDLIAVEATLLPDGHVLVRGSSTRDAGFTFAAVLDATTGETTPTTPEPWGVATLLADGRVLFTGSGSAAANADAAVFDPTTGVLVPIGPMVRPASGTITVLRDGRVLLAGGQGSRKRATASAQVFDPVSGRFTAVGPMVTPRYDHTATLLPDGHVLIAGGRSHQGATGPEGKTRAIASAEVFDPAAGTFAAVGDMTTPRLGHTATLLPDDRVLILGGFDPRNRALASAETFDPDSGRFQSLAGPLQSLADGLPGPPASTGVPDVETAPTGSPGSGLASPEPSVLPTPTDSMVWERVPILGQVQP